MVQYKNDYILHNYVKINIVIYYNFNYLRSGGAQNVTVIRAPACVNTIAALTNRTYIGKLYTVLSPLYSLLRFIMFGPFQIY